jgi:hypothetical protein
MTANEKFDNPQRRAFIAYCRANAVEKKWRERGFSGTIETDSGFYHYYPPCGSHDHFIIQIDIADFTCQNKIFALGFQYENETVKLNCWRPGIYYNESEKAEIVGFIPVFEKNKYIYERCNWPQARAYISLSKKARSLGELPGEAFAEKLFAEFKEAVGVTERLRIELEKMGCQFC